MSFGGLHVHGQAQQQVLGLQAQAAHELQGVAVSADEDVLAVVQRQALVLNAPGPPAQLGRGLQEPHMPALLGGTNGSRQARPAAAHDGESAQKRPSACIFQASQSLRAGVRATRWVSTGKRAASISRSKVR